MKQSSCWRWRAGRLLGEVGGCAGGVQRGGNVQGTVGPGHGGARAQGQARRAVACSGRLGAGGHERRIPVSSLGLPV